MRRFGLWRAMLGAIIGGLFVALALVQFASESLTAAAAAPGTLPTRLSPQFGTVVYSALLRLAPAPYVEATLARHALERSDPTAAQRYALGLPASPVRDELLAQVARARGQNELAMEYFLAAFDIEAVQADAQRIEPRDPAAAYAREGILERRLHTLGRHPDAVAQARWQMGLFANREAWRRVPGSVAQHSWLRRALANFDSAAALAPLSQRYAIADANQADLLGERDRARQLFARAADNDPHSADAVAGLGVVAAEAGDRVAALEYLRRARDLDSTSPMVRALERRLRQPTTP